jgi:hypothetical protein
VFIDDLPGNISVAAQMGIVTLHYTTAGQLRRDLRGLGLPIAE